MGIINMVQALNQALIHEMDIDKDIVIIGEDVGKNGGVFRVTEGLQDKFGTNRVIDTPLAELGIVGSAIGMAVYGMKPVVEIQFAGFIYSAIEQIFSHASRIRSRSRGRYTCQMLIRAPYGIGIKPPELHSDSPEALFCHMPGLKVVVPSSPYKAKGLLISAIRDADPVIFLEPSILYRRFKENVPDEEYTIPLGKADIYKEGKDFTVVTWGAMLHRVVQATEGFDCEIIDLMTLKPIDEEAILSSTKKTGKLIIVHEATRNCGLGAEIAALVSEEAFKYLKAPVVRIAAPEAVIPMARLEDNYIPDIERIKKACWKIMEAQNGN